MTARAPKWNRRFANTINMADGTTFATLRDAADWIIAHQPPNAGAAIERLMDAAERGGSVDDAETAVRIALLVKLDFAQQTKK
jgi:hypothetical protein